MYETAVLETYDFPDGCFSASLITCRFVALTYSAKTISFSRWSAPASLSIVKRT